MNDKLGVLPFGLRLRYKKGNISISMKILTFAQTLVKWFN